MRITGEKVVTVFDKFKELEGKLEDINQQLKEIDAKGQLNKTDAEEKMKNFCTKFQILVLEVNRQRQDIDRIGNCLDELIQFKNGHLQLEKLQLAQFNSTQLKQLEAKLNTMQAQITPATETKMIQTGTYLDTILPI